MDRWQAAREFDALTAERDRLTAENAELRASIETISKERNLFLQQRTEAIDKGVYWQDKSKTHERMLRAANTTLDAIQAHHEMLHRKALEISNEPLDEKSED